VTAPKDWEHEVAGQLLARLNDLHQRIEKEPNADPSFAGILSCLALRLHDEFERLTDPKAPLSTKAWACRNLLETHVQVRYVLTSAENAKSYGDDAWVDQIQLLQAFRVWADILGTKLAQHIADFGLTNEQTLFTAALDESIGKLKIEKINEGVAKDSYVSVQAMAAHVGMQEEFKHINKLTSKLVHPTAYSVLVAADWMPRVLPNIDEILIHSGSINCVEALQGLERHIKEKGLFPALDLSPPTK